MSYPLIENTDRLWPGSDPNVVNNPDYLRGRTNPHCAGCDSYLIGVPLGWMCRNYCVKPQGDS